MPSMMTHAVVGVGALALTRFGKRSPALWVVSAALAALPDLDVITIALGVPGGTMWSHRGITHSLAAAFLTGTLLATLSARWSSAPRWPLALYFSLVMASHGILDAFTSGGRGVALFAPFDARRYAFPVRPIPSAPSWTRAVMPFVIVMPPVEGSAVRISGRGAPTCRAR